MYITLNLLLLIIIGRLCVGENFKPNNNGNLNFRISINSSGDYVTKPRDNSMIFPNDSKTEIGSQTSESCVYGLCESIDNYPAAKIENLLNGLPMLQNYFSESAVDIDIGSRDQFDVEEEPLCSTTRITKFPKQAVNLKQERKLIINTDVYKQGVDYHVCEKDGKRCKFAEFFPNYEGTCQQKYVVRRLMIFEEGNANKVFDDFRVPSCCVCTIKRTS